MFIHGEIMHGQCGHGTDDREPINKPKLIESVKEFAIDSIDCGYSLQVMLRLWIKDIIFLVIMVMENVLHIMMKKIFIHHFVWIKL